MDIRKGITPGAGRVVFNIFEVLGSLGLDNDVGAVTVYTGRNQGTDVQYFGEGDTRTWGIEDTEWE